MTNSSPRNGVSNERHFFGSELVLFPYHRVLRTKTKRRMFRKIALAKETLPEKKFVAVVASYMGRVKHCAGHDLERKIALYLKSDTITPMETFGNRNESEPSLVRQENIVERSHAGALSGESYEDASKALERVEAIKKFREQVKKLPMGGFYSVFEDITNINRAPISREEKNAQIVAFAEEAEARASRFSPRVADMYLGILSRICGEEYMPQFDMTREKLESLSNEGDLQVLLAGDFSWEMKMNRIETRLRGYLGGARALDKREGHEMTDEEKKEREEKLTNAPTNPPERRNERKPGVNFMDRLENGERAPALWSIFPYFRNTKYFKEQTFHTWDNARNTWVEGEYEYSDVSFVPLCEKEEREKGFVNLTMKARALPGSWVNLPLPYTHGLHKIEAGNRVCHVKQDQNGDIVFMVPGDDAGEVEVTVTLSPVLKTMESAGKNAPSVPNFTSVFSDETNKKLEAIGQDKRGNVVRAKKLAAYSRARVQYLKPKSPEEADFYNNFYHTHAGGFAGAVDEIRKADCKTSMTYHAGLGAKIQIPIRYSSGHSVKGRDEHGGSSINSGTGHAWSEVWDEIKHEWVMMDATSAGDPNLEDDEKGEKQGDGIPGDDMGEEAVRPSDEELEKLRQKLAERKEELSYTREERELAEAGGVEPKEARKIVKEINEAENTRLPNGELLVDVLSDLFGAIIKSRKTKDTGYTGPVSQSEGGEEIENIVSHFIQANSGNADPISRSVSTEEAKIEKIIGGFDYYQIGDKTASMGTVADGETLLEMQRRAEYVILSSLHRFARNLKQAGIREERSLAVRSQAISFKGDNEVDQDKPLSADFSAQDKVRLWKSLSHTAAGEGEIAALSHVFNQITEERELLKKEGKEDNRLRLIIACSDGGGGDAGQVHLLAEKFHELNAMLVGVGLTETGAAVPIIYDTPHSRGDIAQDINDLPLIVGKHLVQEAVKLFPEHAKANAVKLTEDIINKFKKA